MCVHRFTRRARGNDVDVIVNNVIRNQDFDLFDEDGYFLLYGRGNSRNGKSLGCLICGILLTPPIPPLPHTQTYPSRCTR